MNLSAIDFKILKYIDDNAPIAKVDLLKAMSSRKYNTEHRLELMLKLEYRKILDRRTIAISGSSLVTYSKFRTERNELGEVLKSPEGGLVLTDKGRSILLDHLHSARNNQRDRQREFIFRILPILISLLALMKSYESEIISALQWLMQ